MNIGLRAWSAVRLLGLLLVGLALLVPAGAEARHVSQDTIPEAQRARPLALSQQVEPPYILVIQAAYCPVSSITIPGGGVVKATVLYNDLSCCANFGCSWYNHKTGPAGWPGCSGGVRLWSDVETIDVVAAHWEQHVGDTYLIDTGTSGVLYGQRPDGYCSDNGPIPPWTATRRSEMELAITPATVNAEKLAFSDAVAPGGTVTYTVNLYWDSVDGQPADSTLTDPVPQYTEYVPGSAWSNLGSVDVGDPSRIAWSGSIPDEGVATIRYSLRVPCAGLMDKPTWEWPTGIINRATGRIGPEEFAIFVAPEGVTLLKPDLKITGLELTQAIQNLNNDVPLIKGKETYARLYVQAEYPDGLAGCDVPEVTAELRGAPGSALTPINDSITARVLAGQDRPALAERDDARQSLFFRLPRTWYDYGASYVLTAEINPTAERPDADLANNKRDQNVALARTREQPLYLVPIRYTAAVPPVTPNKDDFIRALQMIRMWPIAYENLDIRWLRPYELPYTLQYDVPQTMFVNGLHWLYAANSRLKSGHYLAVLPGVVPTGGVSGAALMPGKVAWVLQRPDPQATGSTMVHELSHNLDRKHVDCPPSPDPNEPSGPYEWPNNYPVCQLSDGARDGYYGFDAWDARGRYVRNPRTYADIMSYAQRRWISDFTYKGVYEKLKPTADLAETASMAQEDRLLVSGIITPGLSSARLEYVYLSDNPHFMNDPMTGTYILELQDAGGQVLVSDTFGVRLTDESEGAVQSSRVPSLTSLPFLRALPADPLAGRLVLKDGDTVLATRLASSNAPAVTWTVPNGGGELAGTVDLAWTGHDDDGDPLTYIVQYSADGGATWEPVAIHITDTQTTVDMAEFPGGDQCLFRVVASDGFYTAIDQADGFSTAARQAPTAYILTPEEGQRYPGGQPMTFHGAAHDQDLATLSGAGLAWVSDRDGALGTGSLLEAALSLGCHTVTMTATDGQGLMAADQVTFCVGFAAYLPLVLR